MLPTTLHGSSARTKDGHLWVIALGFSLFFNLGFLALVGIGVVNAQIFQKVINRVKPPSVTSVNIVTIFPTVATSPPIAVHPAPVEKPRFARTSPAQTSERPEKPAFIGERETQATSDRKPDANAPHLPSQKGILPKNSKDYETTESNFKEGALSQNNASTNPPPQPVSPPPTPQKTESAHEENLKSGKLTEIPGTEKSAANPYEKEHLMDGPNPVDISVPKVVSKLDRTKPPQPTLPKEGKTEMDSNKTFKSKSQPAPKDPAFAGFQRKTAIVGSITRNGQSALAVENTALGRYQAIISRAVELEWQRNCVRHRDFITPGFLTIRFFVETNGKVRTVQFVGEMETGEIQKGFTLNSIRDAAIPPMPAALKKEYAKEPLELIFNFYF